MPAAADPAETEFLSPLDRLAEVSFSSQESANLDTVCYRGSAPLAHLAIISQADVFDQVLNPEGLQRDLSPKHASEAYEYLQRRAKEAFPRAFPEVVLNVRDEKAVNVEARKMAGGIRPVKLTFDMEYIRKKRDAVVVSRVDGNHRLWYAAGDARREPIMLMAPFQIHLGLSVQQEGSLFLDINANQKGLNSSHLSILRSSLTPWEEEIVRNPARAFAKRLVEDSGSPWNGLVHLGGSKEGSKQQGIHRPVNFTSLETGTKRLLTKSQYIYDLTQPDAQYQLIVRYWSAVRDVYQEEWENPQEYLLLKNLGVLIWSMFGATVIDRSLSSGAVSQRDMVKLVKKTTGRLNWERNATGEGSLAGMSGNRAALILSGELAAALDADRSVGKGIEQQLLDDDDDEEEKAS